MSLIETTDYQRVSKTIASEVANAVAAGAIAKGAVPVPDAGILELCQKKGDLLFVDTVEPRIVGWYHPLSVTDVQAMHLWGPSSTRLLQATLLLAVANLLLSKGFVTAHWEEGNPLGVGATLLHGGTRTGSALSVNLAAAKISLTAAIPLP